MNWRAIIATIVAVIIISTIIGCTKNGAWSILFIGAAIYILARLTKGKNDD